MNNDTFFGFCIIFGILIFLLCLICSFGVRLEKLEILHKDYSVCTECGNVVHN